MIGAEDFPPFAPQPPWWGGDLQTIRNYLRRRLPGLGRYPARRLEFPMNDGSGDRLTAALHEPEGGGDRPLLILVHGLSGCEGSAYIIRSADYLLRAGYRVMRLNLRGAGPARWTCRYQYHAGRTEDLRRVFADLPPDLAENGLLVVGYSLGGNMLLKYLGEEGAAAPLVAAATISAPIDLASTAWRFHALRNRLYLRWLLARMKEEATGGAAELSERERRAVAEAHTIVAFDDTFVAPRNGFASAEDYYARCSARPFMPDVRVPTLVIHARNDPWIPAIPYLTFNWRSNPALVPLLPKGGGHVGFHDRHRGGAWHDRCVARFAAFQAVAAPNSCE